MPPARSMRVRTRGSYSAPRRAMSGLVPGISLDWGKPAGGVDRRDLVEFGERQIDDPRAFARQGRTGIGKGARHLGREPVEDKALQDPEPQPRGRHHRRRPALCPWRLARHHRVGDRAAGDAIRQGADRIESRRERGRPVARDAALGRLEADEAAQRRRDPHRAAGIAADRDHGLRIAHRHRRARGRAAGDQLAVKGVSGRPVMRVDANPGKGELGHVGAADEDRPGGAQPGDDRRVAGRRRAVVERLRASQGGFPRDIEEVLDRHRQAGQGRGDIPRLAQAILRVGGGAGAVGVDPDEAARAFARGVGDPRQRRLDQSAAGGAPSGQILGEAKDCRLLRSGRRHGILPVPITPILSPRSAACAARRGRRPALRVRQAIAPRRPPGSAPPPTRRHRCRGRD